MFIYFLKAHFRRNMDVSQIVLVLNDKVIQAWQHKTFHNLNKEKGCWVWKKQIEERLSIAV